MQFKYQGKNITNIVEIKKADITDNAGGIADSVEMHFDDPKRLWSQWNPQKNDHIEISQDGFGSGLMYIDELEQQSGLFLLKALSIPQEAKTANTKSWEKIRLLQIAEEIARKYGFQLKTYGIQNYYYERIDQVEQADFEFLATRCMLEGYMLKVNGQSVIIYDERYMECQEIVRTINQNQFDGRYGFKNKSTGIFHSCKITYGDISYIFVPNIGPSGPVLKIVDLYCSTQGEAQRYSKNLLRLKNKYEYTGYCTIEIDPGIAAGNVIKISDIGYGEGDYFINQIIHRLVEQKSFLRLRKPLKEY